MIMAWNYKQYSVIIDLNEYDTQNIARGLFLLQKNDNRRKEFR